MKRMMDVRERILKILDEKPGDTFSVSQVARAIGATNKAATAALNKLLKNDLVERPQKGLYTSKQRPAAAPAPEQGKPRKIEKTTEQELVASVPLSVVTVELLVEGERSQIDVGRVLGKIREDNAILDARVRKVVEADQSKLKIRYAFANKE